MENKSFYTAFLAFQSEGIKLHKDSTNPHYKSRYLSLPALLEAVVPALNKHGLILMQSPTLYSNLDGVRPALRTSLMHAESCTGQEQEMLLALDGTDSQALGRALTYARRYMLLAMLGLEADEDTDGETSTYRLTENGAERVPREQLPATQPQVAKIHALAKERGMDHDQIKAEFGVASFADLTRPDASEIIERLSR